MKKEEIQKIRGKGNPGLEVAMTDDGYKLFIDRFDGRGVAIEISEEEYKSLERTFMFTDK